MDLGNLIDYPVSTTDLPGSTLDGYAVEHADNLPTPTPWTSVSNNHGVRLD
jgi:hypothetical protein